MYHHTFEAYPLQDAVYLAVIQSEAEVDAAVDATLDMVDPDVIDEHLRPSCLSSSMLEVSYHKCSNNIYFAGKIELSAETSELPSYKVMTRGSNLDH